MKDSGTFVQSLVAADANNIITVVDFNQILSPYKEFEIDYIVSHAIVLEDFQIKCGLFSLLEADVPTTNALASQASQDAEDARIKKEGQKIYLDIFHAYGNGPWIQKAEEILQNKNSLEQAWALMAPAFSTNETALIDEDLKIGVRVSSKAQGVGGLKGNDYLRIFGSWRKVTTFHKKKDNSVEALQDRISALELLLGIFGAPSVTLPGSNGLVPAPPVGGGNFLLRGDRSWQNPNFFAALNLPQTFTANQTFSGLMSVGLDKDLVPQSFSLTDTRTINSLQVLNTAHAVATIASNPAATFVFSNNDFDISPNSNVPVSQLCLGANYRIKNYATGIFTNIQGLRLTALNLGAGNVATLDGASFNARNDSANTTVTHLNGGNFTAALNNIAATVTNLTSGSFTVSAAAASFASTVRGILIKASSSNTTPAVNCIGLDVESITGTATNKLAVRTGAGRVIFGDTTAASSTTAAAVTAHSLGIATTIYAGGLNLPSLPTSPTGLVAGTLYRSGNQVLIV